MPTLHSRTGPCPGWGHRLGRAPGGEVANSALCIVLSLSSLLSFCLFLILFYFSLVSLSLFPLPPASFFSTHPLSHPKTKQNNLLWPYFCTWEIRKLMWNCYCSDKRYIQGWETKGKGENESVEFGLGFFSFFFPLPPKRKIRPGQFGYLLRKSQR